jgi:adenosylhomocysteine nucleosidase
MTGPLLFVAADPRECAAWVRHWDESHPVALPVHWAQAGTWKGREVIAVANGAGAERARAAVFAVPNASMVCSIGFCGALDRSLAIADVFEPGEVRNGTRSWFPLTAHGRLAKSGVLISIDRVAQTALEKRNLRNTGASVVEMEAAAVARASEERNVPFYCIRAVSDLADEDFANDFNKCFMPDGRLSVPRLIAGACANPVRRFRELARLARRTALASKKLGEFLADCSF